MDSSSPYSLPTQPNPTRQSSAVRKQPSSCQCKANHARRVTAARTHSKSPQPAQPAYAKVTSMQGASDFRQRAGGRAGKENGNHLVCLFGNKGGV